MSSAQTQLVAFRYVMLIFLVVGIGNSCVAGHHNAGDNYPQPIEHPIGDMGDSSESESDDKESDDDNLYGAKLFPFGKLGALSLGKGDLDRIHDDPSSALASPPPKF